MIRNAATILILAAFALGARAQNSPPHQHATTTDVIDGSTHPELIPDSVAYRMVFLHLTVPANYVDMDKKVQLSHLGKVGLPVTDLQAFLVIMTEFRSKYDAWHAHWNIQAEAEGSKFDPAILLAQQQDFVQATRGDLRRSLSPVGMLRLDAFVQAEKKAISIHKGGGQ